MFFPEHFTLVYVVKHTFFIILPFRFNLEPDYVQCYICSIEELATHKLKARDILFFVTHVSILTWDIFLEYSLSGEQITLISIYVILLINHRF